MNQSPTTSIIILLVVIMTGVIVDVVAVVVLLLLVIVSVIITIIVIITILSTIIVAITINVPFRPDSSDDFSGNNGCFSVDHMWPAKLGQLCFGLPGGENIDIVAEKGVASSFCGCLLTLLCHTLLQRPDQLLVTSLDEKHSEIESQGLVRTENSELLPHLCHLRFSLLGSDTSTAVVPRETDSQH